MFITMKTLHILNKSPDHGRFRQCLEAAQATDQILLIEDAVLSLAVADVELPKATRALEADAAARGLSGVAPEQLIDYRGMVELSASADRIISW